jgi:hypothetical protein
MDAFQYGSFQSNAFQIGTRGGGSLASRRGAKDEDDDMRIASLLTQILKQTEEAKTETSIVTQHLSHKIDMLREEIDNKPTVIMPPTIQIPSIRPSGIMNSIPRIDFEEKRQKELHDQRLASLEMARKAREDNKRKADSIMKQRLSNLDKARKKRVGKT